MANKIKQCLVCRKYLKIEKFYFKKDQKDGKSSVCIICSRERARAYREKHRYDKKNLQKEVNILIELNNRLEQENKELKERITKCELLQYYDIIATMTVPDWNLIKNYF